MKRRPDVPSFPVPRCSGSCSVATGSNRDASDSNRGASDSATTADAAESGSKSVASGDNKKKGDDSKEEPKDEKQSETSVLVFCLKSQTDVACRIHSVAYLNFFHVPLRFSGR